MNRVWRIPRKRVAIVGAVLVLLLAGGGFAYAATVPNPDPCDSQWKGTGSTNDRIAQLRNYMDCRSDRIERAIPEATVTVPGPTTTVTVTGTPTTTSPTTTTTTTTSTTTSPTTTTTTTTPAGWGCTVPLGQNCGAYSYAGIPNSNGYNTYVANQSVGPQNGTTQTLNANNPGDWQVVANAVPYGYRGVQTYPDVQQLFNNWPWGPNGCDPNCTDTPLASLSDLKINYAETSPLGPNDKYQFSPDIWTANYGSDIMFWVDVRDRCDEGAFGSTVLGHAVIDGQGWTVHRYGGPGAEVIFVLDGPGGQGTCATQTSGTINVKAGLEWLVANGHSPGPMVLQQVNTGWEITSAENATFTMSQYSITAPVA